MGHHSLGKRIMIRIFLSAILLVALKNGVIKAQVMDRSEDTYKANNREPDERYKADILIVVAHPHDEGLVAAYIARAIDQKRRVAIVWTNLGDGGLNGGVNAVGRE